MKVFALIGSMGTGKTTVYNALIKKGFVGIKECTTRPMRLGEENSNQYIFVDDWVYDLAVSQKRIIGQSSFLVSSGKLYRYGFHLNSLPIDTENNCVVQANYQSLQDLKSFYGKDLYVVKLVRDEEAIIKSAMKRGDDESEIARRIKKDFKIYNDINGDYCLDNLTIQECVSEIEKIGRCD